MYYTVLRDINARNSDALLKLKILNVKIVLRTSVCLSKILLMEC